MKKIIFGLFITLSSLMYSQEKHCSDFKIGNFIYKDAPYTGWTVVRGDSLQVESNKSLNWHVEGTVKWISECKYELTYTKAVSDDLIGKTVYVEIVEIKENEIICRSTLDGVQFDFRMEKIASINGH
ncbi:MAG: hypothetical protein EOO46_14645 [Flavobacterium sp.]|nr:MAG: hypothetical protein EOO46_14645 [Flavobacterium sp.]